MIRDILIPLLSERFPGRFTVGEQGVEPCVTFPAKHPEVGDVQIHDDGDEITLIAGNFTHGHFSNYDEIPLEEKEREIAEDVIDFLTKLFADEVVLFGSHKGGGGWRVGREEPRGLMSKTMFGRKNYVWSGPLEADHTDDM